MWSVRENQNGTSELMHYGVLGMKWGIRKNPDKAYAKASSKLRKLDKKLTKKNAKTSKLLLKASKKMNKAFTGSAKVSGFGDSETANSVQVINLKKQKKAEKVLTKYYKALYRSDKAKKKAYSWYDKVAKTFEGVELKNIRQEDIDLGYAYAQMLFEDARRGYG